MKNFITTAMINPARPKIRSPIAETLLTVQYSSLDGLLSTFQTLIDWRTNDFSFLCMYWIKKSSLKN